MTSETTRNRTIPGIIRHLEQLPGGLIKLWLDLSIDGFEHNHCAGQYLQLYLNEQWVPFSIASMNSGSNNLIELHIATQSDEKHQCIMDAFAAKQPLQVDYPLGQVRLPAEIETLYLFCRGTGFSPSKALIEEALTRNPQRRIHLVWEGKTAQELYFVPWLNTLVDQHQFLNIHICLPKHEPFTTIDGLNADHVSKHETMFEWLASNQSAMAFHALDWFYFCASPERVYELLDRLLSLGVDQNRTASDVYEYAPRA